MEVEAPLLEIKGTEDLCWASSSWAGSGSMDILSSAASLEMHLSRIAVFACEVSRHDVLASKAMFLKELII